eukprot:9922865-Heterocapsa_arctica.AAC.1
MCIRDRHCAVDVGQHLAFFQRALHPTNFTLTSSSLLGPSTILSLLLPTCRQIAVTQRRGHRPAHQAQLLQDRLVPQLVD